MLLRDVSRLWSYRELVTVFVWRDIAVRYKQSIMGVLWAVLTPALIVASGAIIRLVVSVMTDEPITAEALGSVIVKAAPWGFFTAVVRGASGCLVGNAGLVGKIAFPKEVFPVSVVISSLIDFAVATVVVVLVLAFVLDSITVQVLWVLPIIAILIAGSLGVALFLAAANLFYRDVKYLVEVFLTYAVFVTPVFYDISMLGDYGRYLLLNPVAPLLEALSATVVRGQIPDWQGLTYSTVVALVALLGGYRYFKHSEVQFAERL